MSFFSIQAITSTLQDIIAGLVWMRGQTAVLNGSRPYDCVLEQSCPGPAGCSRGWMCGRRCSETLLKHMDEAGNDLCRSKCPFLKVFETDQPAAQNLILHKQDDGTLKVRAVFTPIRDANGTVVEVLEAVLSFGRGGTSMIAGMYDQSIMNMIQKLKEDEDEDSAVIADELYHIGRSMQDDYLMGIAVYDRARASIAVHFI